MLTRYHQPKVVRPCVIYTVVWASPKYAEAFLVIWWSLPSARRNPSYGDCLEVKREYYQNCSVLDCVTLCSQSAAHLYQHFIQVQQFGFVTLGLYAMRRGGCLELYHCNMVEWFWWNSSLISTTNWFQSSPKWPIMCKVGHYNNQPAIL